MGQSLILNQQKYEESESNSKRMHKYSECFQNSFKRYLPITGWLPNYTLSNLQCDFVAGVTVGLMVIPQGLAYASLAGLQTQYGLYSAFMGCFVYCVFGSAKDVTLGPTAILSLMVAIYGNPSQPEFTVAFTFFVGIILLAMGILRLGFLVKFISVPVISAFTSAAAITIAVSQLKDILGLHNIPRDFIPSIITTFRSLEHINYWDIIFGLGCIILLVLLKQLSKIKWREDENYQLPLIQRCARKFLWLVGIGRNAVVVLVSLLLAYCFVEQGKNIFTLSDDIDFTLPPFEVGFQLYYIFLP